MSDNEGPHWNVMHTVTGNGFMSQHTLHSLVQPHKDEAKQVHYEIKFRQNVVISKTHIFNSLSTYAIIKTMFCSIFVERIDSGLPKTTENVCKCNI